MRACGHGLKRELDPYRGVRMYLMNCGEVQCGLSESDFFGSLPIAHEWIDAALNGETDGWHGLSKIELLKARGAK